jgi:hypothetical protein
MQLYKNLLITLYNINKDSKMYHYAAYCAVDCTTNHGYHCCDVTLDEIIDEVKDMIDEINNYSDNDNSPEIRFNTGWL